jgi:hypothetical protein
MSADLITFPGKVPPPAGEGNDTPATPADYHEVVELPKGLPEAAREAMRWLSIANWRCERGSRFARKEVQEIIDKAIKELQDGIQNSRKAGKRVLGPDLLAAFGPVTKETVPTLQSVFSILYFCLSPSEDDDPNPAA